MTMSFYVFLQLFCYYIYFFKIIRRRRYGNTIAAKNFLSTKIAIFFLKYRLLRLQVGDSKSQSLLSFSMYILFPVQGWLRPYR